MAARSHKQLMGAALAAAALLSTACGKDAPAGVKPPKPVVPLASAAPSQPAAGADPRVAEMRVAVQAASDAVRNFQAIAHTKMRTAAGASAFNTAKVFWRRQGTMACTVTAAESEKKVGTKLIFDGDHSVKVRTYFFGFIPLKITLDVEDPRLVDSSKRSLKDTSTERMLETLLHPQAQVVPLGDGEAVGEAIALYEVRSPLKWKGMEKDVFGVSKRLNLPIVRDAYDASGKILFHMEMRQMRTNVTIPAAEWTLD